MAQTEQGGDAEGHGQDRGQRDPERDAGGEAVEIVPAAVRLADHDHHHDVDRRVDQHRDHRQPGLPFPDQMAVDEAKEKLDKEAEEKREAAKEKKEEEEALEERIEARRGERKEREERAEDISDMQENVLVHDDMVDDAQQEIKDMMNKMKLLDEDLKGAAVDKQM